MALDLVINGDRAVVPNFASFSLTFDFGFLCSLLISVITVGRLKCPNVAFVKKLCNRDVT